MGLNQDSSLLARLLAALRQEAARGNNLSGLGPSFISRTVFGRAVLTERLFASRRLFVCLFNVLGLSRFGVMQKKACVKMSLSLTKPRRGFGAC